MNRGNLEFDALQSRQSGFYAPKDVRDLLFVGDGAESLLLVGNNNAALSAFSILSPSLSPAQ